MSTNRLLMTGLCAIALSLVTPIFAAQTENNIKTNYENACALCHGDDGKGAMPGVPDLTSSGTRLEQPLAVLVKNVVNGMPARMSVGMPPMGGSTTFNQQDIEKLVEYMKTNFLKR